ncbi:MAG TPA: hypothetical protein VF146_19160 [Bryobacteraceae bacterium]
MRVHSPYRCDYCMNMKGETNHWWLRRPDREQFTLLRWDQVLADTAGYEHICSESCAAKALSKWMAQIGSQVSARVTIQTEVPLRTQ